MFSLTKDTVEAKPRQVQLSTRSSRLSLEGREEPRSKQEEGGGREGQPQPRGLRGLR